MKRRVAEIITKFTTEGLSELRRALRDVGEDARRAQAQNGSRSVAGELRGIGAAARDARVHTRGLKADLGSGEAFGRGLREVRAGFAGIGREIGRLSGIWRPVDREVTAGARATVRRVVGAFGDIGRGLGRSVLAGLLMGSTALGRLGSLAGDAAKQVIGAFVKAGSLIAKTVFSKTGIIGAAIAALGAGAYQLLTPALGGLAFGGAAVAGILTSIDLKGLRQASAQLGVSPAVIQQWQALGNVVDVTQEEIIGGLTTLQSKITESLDPESDAAKLFSLMGINARDALGKMRPVTDVLKEIAVVSQKLTPEGRSFLFENLLGDATVFSELMARYAQFGQGIEADWAEKASRGLFVSDEQLTRITGFRGAIQDLAVTAKAFLRELYVAFIPAFQDWGEAIDLAFSTVEKRQNIIDKAFVQPFRKGLVWIEDFAKVFFGFDIRKSIFGEASQAVVNTWMITVKKVLDDLIEVGGGLGALFLGLGKAILAVSREFDAFVQAQTGFSISDWLKSSAGADVGAFFRDLGLIASNAFTGSFDGAGLQTSLGRWLSGWLETVKREIEPVRAYLAQTMTQVFQAVQNGTGLDGATNGLARVIILAGQVAVALAAFGQEFYRVFFGGQAAGAGFEWLDQLKSVFDTVLATVREIAAILAPIIASLGPEGIAKVIVGKFAADIAGKVLTPGGIVAGATIAGTAIGNFFKPSKVTDNAAPENERDRKAMDAEFDRTGGPKAALRKAYEAGLADYETRDRSLSGEYMRGEYEKDEAEKRAEAEQAPAKLGSVDVVAQGIPIVLQFGQAVVNTIAPQASTDDVVRAAGSMIGRR